MSQVLASVCFLYSLTILSNPFENWDHITLLCGASCAINASSSFFFQRLHSSEAGQRAASLHKGQATAGQLVSCVLVKTRG